jgi:SAM-dependent methyltransferase
MDAAQPSQPDDWNSRFESGQIPWDFGGVPAALQEYLRRKPKGSNPSARSSVLIPGCGSGYEIKAFAEAGFDVTAIDVAPAAVERARKHAGPALAKQIIQGDFFFHDFPAASFDIIYERSFICSLLPERRKAYRDRVASLLKYRGFLLGYFYYQKPVLEAGPPFGFAWGTADELFARHFLLGKDEPVADSLPVFAGHERWQEWHRTSYCG